MLRQLSTPENSGRISGFGLAAAYVGSVMLLLVVYFGFISGKGVARGLLHVSAGDGMNVRLAMLLAAGWFAVFALPLLLTAHLLPSVVEVARLEGGMLAGYRKLWSDLTAEWHRDRNLVYYLVASALFRDGLTGVFTFGGVLGVNAYGISPAEVLIFGAAASVVAAVGAVLGGLFRRPHRIQAGDRRITGQHHRSGTDLGGAVRSPVVLDLRTAVVPVYRAARCRLRGRCCCVCRERARRVWPSASTR